MSGGWARLQEVLATDEDKGDLDAFVGWSGRFEHWYGGVAYAGETMEEAYVEKHFVPLIPRGQEGPDYAAQADEVAGAVADAYLEMREKQARERAEWEAEDAGS